MGSAANILSPVFAQSDDGLNRLLGLDLPFDLSLAAVVAAEAVIVILVIVEWTSDARRNRRGPPTIFGYLGVMSCLILAAMAFVNRQYVFASAQLVHTLVFLRITVVLHRRRPTSLQIEGPQFPVVAPDKAHKKSPIETRS